MMTAPYAHEYIDRMDLSFMEFQHEAGVKRLYSHEEIDGFVESRLKARMGEAAYRKVFPSRP